MRRDVFLLLSHTTGLIGIKTPYRGAPILIGRRKIGHIAVPTKLSVLLAPAFFGLVQPLLALAQQTQQPSGPQPLWNCTGPWHMWGGGWEFWWIFPMGMLFLIVLAIFLIGRRSGAGGPHHWGSSWPMMDGRWGPGRPWADPTYSALKILNERLARGEIQKQEYEEKKLAILSRGQH